MTYEEAKEMLDADIEVARDEMANALLMAKQALEKQIPKKVDRMEFDIDEFNTDDRHLIHICCPICGRALRLFNVKEFCCFNGNIVEPFCSKCGQALDWNEGAETYDPV